LAVSLALAGAILAAAEPAPRALGFSLRDVNPRSPTYGRKLELRELCAERGVVLRFTASWCEHCRAELPALRDFFARQEVPLVLVAADEHGYPESMGIVAERTSLATPILYASPRRAERLARHYTHEVLPATYLIDRAGRIVRRFEGAQPIDELARAIGSDLGSTPRP